MACDVSPVAMFFLDFKHRQQCIWVFTHLSQSHHGFAPETFKYKQHECLEFDFLMNLCLSFAFCDQPGSKSQIGEFHCCRTLLKMSTVYDFFWRFSVLSWRKCFDGGRKQYCCLRVLISWRRVCQHGWNSIFWWKIQFSGEEPSFLGWKGTFWGLRRDWKGTWLLSSASLWKPLLCSGKYPEAPLWSLISP